MGGHGTASSGSEEGYVVGACEHGNEPSYTTICREFFVQLRNK
jgi:hypothetical protein